MQYCHNKILHCTVHSALLSIIIAFLVTVYCTVHSALLSTIIAFLVTVYCTVHSALLSTIIAFLVTELQWISVYSYFVIFPYGKDIESFELFVK